MSALVSLIGIRFRDCCESMVKKRDNCEIYGGSSVVINRFKCRDCVTKVSGQAQGVESVHVPQLILVYVSLCLFWPFALSNFCAPTWVPYTGLVVSIGVALSTLG